MRRFLSYALLPLSVIVLASGCGRTVLRIDRDGGEPTIDATVPDATVPDAGCTSSAQCDDFLVCNGLERCERGLCIAGDAPSCDDGIDCTRDVCDPMADACRSTPDPLSCMPGTLCDPDRGGCVVVPCDSDVDCNDGLVCNGLEQCIEGRCRGTMPPFCNDGIECTDDRCDEGAGGCLNTPADRDGDGFQPTECGGPDCDDTTPLISPAAPETCDSGLDDDCNGRVDCDDPACRLSASCRCAPSEACGEGRDADCDGAFDCADSDCAATPACMMPCTGRELGSMFGARVATGTTVGATETVVPTCGNSRAPDVLHRWTAPRSGAWTFDTIGSSYDTVLALLQSCTGPELACNDDIPSGGGSRSRITRTMAAGETILIAVTGFMMGAGSYELNITEGGPTAEICDNGVDDDRDGRVDCADFDCTRQPVCCVPRAESCTNRIDDDCDMLVDCGDPDCRTSPTCCIPATEICTDGTDQDCDRLVDCADPDCGGAPACCVAAPEMCGNGIDDDCDRLVDCADPVCGASPECCVPRLEICNNGVDDDCDRRVDCGDIECAASPACCVPAPEMCGNLDDDDCDGLTDCADPECRSAPACCMPVPEMCGNGGDDDCDLRIDCADPDCAGIPPCAPACPDRDLGSRLGLRVGTGTTAGAPNRFVPSCRAGGTAGDRAFTWTAPVTGEYLFDTVGSGFDTVLTLRSSCTGPELPGMCNDDFPGSGNASRLRLTLMAGTRIVIVVDGFGTREGSFVINIVRAFPDEFGLCTDGLDNDGDGGTDCGDSDCAMDTACTGP